MTRFDDASGGFAAAAMYASPMRRRWALAASVIVAGACTHDPAPATTPSQPAAAVDDSRGASPTAAPRAAPPAAAPDPSSPTPPRAGSPGASAGVAADGTTSAIELPEAIEMDPATGLPVRAPLTGEPTCDHLSRALVAAMHCEPQPPGMREKLLYTLTNLLESLRVVPAGDNAARKMLIDGCRINAEGLDEAMVSLGCSTG